MQVAVEVASVAAIEDEDGVHGGGGGGGRSMVAAAFDGSSDGLQIGNVEGKMQLTPSAWRVVTSGFSI